MTTTTVYLKKDYGYRGTIGAAVTVTDSDNELELVYGTVEGSDNINEYEMNHVSFVPVTPNK